MENINSRKVVHHALVGDDNRAISFSRDFSWYVPQYSPNIQHQTILEEHVNSRAPNKLSCLARFVSVEEVDRKKLVSRC